MNPFPQELEKSVLVSYKKLISIVELERPWDSVCQRLGKNKKEPTWQHRVFIPQNHQTVRYLNLARAPCYVRYMGEAEPEVDDDPTTVFNYFTTTAIRIIVRDLFNHMLDTPKIASEHVRKLLNYVQTTRCIQRGEVISVTRRCLNVLYKQPYSDGDLVADVLSKLCSSSQAHVEDIVSDYYSLPTFKYILESCAKAGFNLRDFLVYRTGRSRVMRPTCPVLQNVINGHCSFLKLLFEYGFERYERHMDETNFRYQHQRMFQVLKRQNVKSRLEYYDNYHQYLRRHNLLMETLYLICASFEASPKQCVQCARLLYKSIPDPFLSETELRNLLHECDNRANIVARCQALFSDVLVSTPQPRSLKHLCRCAARKALGDNFQLPSGIHKLGLPRELCKYLTSLT